MKTVAMTDICAFLYRESRLLDDQQWDDWLECYHPQVQYWMPSWDDDGQLIGDPQREISLIFYPTRQGLEDRVFRIKTERSSATIPDTRTTHNTPNVAIERQDGARVTVRFNWHTLRQRYQTDVSHFGRMRYEIDFSDEQPLITNKYVVLKNDYIHQVIDIYHL